MCDANFLSSTLVYERVSPTRQREYINVYLYYQVEYYCILICKHKYNINDISICIFFLLYNLSNRNPIRYLYTLYLTESRPLSSAT